MDKQGQHINRTCRLTRKWSPGFVATEAEAGVYAEEADGEDGRFRELKTMPKNLLFVFEGPHGEIYLAEDKRQLAKKLNMTFRSTDIFFTNRGPIYLVQKRCACGDFEDSDELLMKLSEACKHEGVT